MAVAVVPLIIAAVRAIRDGVYPVFDDALDALLIHDVFSMHPPMVGAGTSFGLIAVEACQPSGTASVRPARSDLCAVRLPSRGSRRLGRRLQRGVHPSDPAQSRVASATALLVVAMAGILLLQRSFGGDVFTSPWNPFLALMAFTAFMFSTWASLVDRRSARRRCRGRCWPGSVGVQAQAAYAPGVAILLGIAGLGAIVRAVRDRSEPRWERYRYLAVAFATGLVAWSLPLVQQITADDGNLGRLIRWLGGLPAHRLDRVATRR